MPNADGRVMLDDQGRRVLNKDGKLACECCDCIVCPPDLASSYQVAGVLDTNLAFGPPGVYPFNEPAGGGDCLYTGSFNTPGSSWPFSLVRLRPTDAPWVPCCGWGIFFEPNFGDGIGVAFRCGDDPVGAYSDVLRDSVNSPGYLGAGEYVNFTGITVT